MIREGARRAAKNTFLSTEGRGEHWGPIKFLFRCCAVLQGSVALWYRGSLCRQMSTDLVVGGTGERVRSSFGVRVGRHKACPYGGHGGRLGGTMWVGDRRHRQYAGDAAPTWHGVGGGVAGGVPPHKGGPKARPLNCSGRWSVVSGRWSVRLRNAGGEGLAPGTVKGTHKGRPYDENGIGGFQDGKGHPQGAPLR